MKKLILTLFFVACATLHANVDEKLFLEPHLSNLAGKIAFQGGQELTADKKASFEHALSVNCGVNLPPTTQVICKNECRITGLGKHLCEIRESLKDNGSAVITAPASYDVVFTSGKRSESEVQKSIQTALEKIGASEDSTFIASCLNTLTDVMRATFVCKNGKMELVTDAKTLSLGEKVWRKNPEGARLEVYHSEEEYLVAIGSAGLVCEEIRRPCFFGEVKWKAYNNAMEEGNQLGSSYMHHHPFTIYLVKKAA